MKILIALVSEFDVVDDEDEEDTIVERILNGTDRIDMFIVIMDMFKSRFV